MKRFCCAILAFAVIIACVIPAMGAVIEQPVSPKYTYIAKLSAALSINKNTGVASCGGSCSAPGGASIKLTCRLQRYNGSSWTTVNTWSTTATQATAINKYSAVASGYTYRVRITCSVYNSSGTLVESGTCYSNQVVY